MNTDMPAEEPLHLLQRELDKQKKINAALIARIEQSGSEGGGAFSIFERAISLEKQVKDRTIALNHALQELERANREMAMAKEIAEQSNQTKSDFLSSVSHELRTPLTSIRGFASLINREFSRSFAPLAEEDDSLQKKSRRITENLDVILKESDHLTRLINDVLDLAKIEAGRIEWRDAPVCPAVLIRDAINAAQGMFAPKPAVALESDIRGELPSFIGDADRLLQVLVNLLNNAAKFTERGTVTVAAFLNDQSMVQIEVRDTGAGFPPEDAEAIFDKFQQSRQGDTLTDKPRGTGLGLAICKEIIEHYGGRIWATSEPGKGSVFSVTLPNSPVTTPRHDATTGGEAAAPGDFSESLPAHTRRLLVVDDDPGIRSYLSQLLREQGYEVIAAADGESAIALAREHHPDLITMDLAMPVMDGRTAISRLRSMPELHSIPIMVVSAIPGWDAAGGDLAMPKPIDEPRFLENIHLLLDRGQGSTTANTHALWLHETGKMPRRTPEGFSARLAVNFCAIDEFPARVRDGFRGMVMVPTSLLGQIDLGLLKSLPALEVLIMPDER